MPSFARIEGTTGNTGDPKFTEIDINSVEVGEAVQSTDSENFSKITNTEQWTYETFK